MPEAFRHAIPAPRFEVRAQVLMDKGIHLGWRWSKWRKGWLSRHPLCADCDRLAQCVHHIVPRHLAPDRIYDESNVMSLCNECHEARHAR